MSKKPPLHFLPLGGAGEIGMNLNLYEYDGSWLMCDLGVTFAGDELPGIDLVMPDLSFIARRKEGLVGLVLTHAHEDHLGAVPYLWPQLRCPVFATPFAAALLRRKLDEGAEGIEDMVITEVPLEGTIDLDPFRIELITLTHSIPEPNALVVHTPHGAIMHTGDWKLDPDPLISEPTDEDALQRIGDEGVLAMVCDSTNVFQPGTSGSEADVRRGLTELISEQSKRVVVTTFASNLARLLTIHETATANGRTCVAVGRSMWRILDCARETGYLPPNVRFLGDRDARGLPDDKVLYMMTGCQGETNAALSRVADGNHPSIELRNGDTVIFSSKIIPGNEKTIFNLINRLARLNVEVITEKDRFVHVSGHPNRDELARMYQLIRPQIAVPVHGELRHIREHANLARSLQVPETVTIENGALLRLAPGVPKVIDHVEHGRLAWNGRGTIPVDGNTIKERRRLMFNGATFVTLVLDGDGDLISDPVISAHGLTENGENQELIDDLIDDAIDAVEGLTAPKRRDDDSVREAVRVALRRSIKVEFNRRPVVEIQLVRVS
ncbi:MAG: ribonuclease J [Rhodospirillaceae bacterium]|jgi:ribonuclease J|nr:ribonuclease J [Rhodospirillaceae bacterium]MBT7646397.1 ribonuclease J [Rhodospirillaceae bacterium]